MQAMGVRHASLWTMLTKELDPAIADNSASRFAHGSYRNAVSDAFKVVETELRIAAAGAGVGRGADGRPDSRTAIRTVLDSWFEEKDTGLRFKDRGWLAAFHKLCDAAFELIRNPLSHPIDSREMTPQQAFTGLCVANLILTELKGAQ